MGVIMMDLPNAEDDCIVFVKDNTFTIYDKVDLPLCKKLSDYNHGSYIISPEMRIHNGVLSITGSCVGYFIKMERINPVIPNHFIFDETDEKSVTDFHKTYLTDKLEYKKHFNIFKRYKHTEILNPILRYRRTVSYNKLYSHFIIEDFRTNG